MGALTVDTLRALPEDVLWSLIDSLDDHEAAALLYDWELWARDNQRLPKGDQWLTWLILAGRGFGKTRTGAETVRLLVESNQAGRVALVAPTAADARDVMIEGESGILTTSPPWFRPTYEPSKRRLTWPNGAVATTFSAEDPESLRGPQFDLAWCDELAAWTYLQDTWDMLQFGLRLGQRPRNIITTTPKPLALVKQLAKDPSTVLTRGSTYDNRANLAPSFFQKVIQRYEGTRLGRQELEGLILDDNPGALWQPAFIEPHRKDVSSLPELLKHCRRIAVGVDPAVTSGEDSAETGIIVAGIDAAGHGYVFRDASLKGSPNEWGQAAVRAYKDLSADRVYPEVNNGGDLVVSNIRNIDANVAVTPVRASRGKAVRAEPIAALYEQGRIHHVGCFPELEEQMMGWNPTDPSAKSPDRVDALVWVLSGLFNVNVSEPGVRLL